MTTEIILNPDQIKAVDYAINKPFAIITGGAGVGKTTIVKEIVKDSESQVALCCPTGKAAARLREATERDTSTIHRLLGYNGKTFSCSNLHGLHIVIDEASMVDSSLMSEIIIRNPDRLTLIGDSAQLPPVGAGQPFHDMVVLRRDLTAQLSICYRATEAIYRAGAAIRSGLQPENARTPGEWFDMTGTGDMESTWKYIEQAVDKGEIDWSKDIILCCKNDHVKEINKRVLTKFGRDEESPKWQPGDRIICTGKNFAEDDVWNGTTGTITGIDSDKKAWVKGDIPFMNKATGEYEAEILWGKGILDTSQHAYALTVHKSQGSQYRKVFFVILGGVYANRSLIYTAVTRAKSECHVIGNIGTFRNGINKIGGKWTLLQEFSKRLQKGVTHEN